MRADWEANDNDTGFCFYCMHWLFGSLVCLEAHLPRPGWSREGLELPTEQGTLTSPMTGEGVGRERKRNGRGMEGRELVEI